jgi:hypothetical protein
LKDIRLPWALADDHVDGVLNRAAESDDSGQGIVGISSLDAHLDTLASQRLPSLDL